MMYFARQIILDTGNRLCNHHAIFVWYGNVTWIYARSDCQLCFIPCLQQAKESMSITQDADSPVDCAKLPVGLIWNIIFKHIVKLKKLQESELISVFILREIKIYLYYIPSISKSKWMTRFICIS